MVSGQEGLTAIIEVVGVLIVAALTGATDDSSFVHARCWLTVLLVLANCAKVDKLVGRGALRLSIGRIVDVRVLSVHS